MKQSRQEKEKKRIKLNEIRRRRKEKNHNSVLWEKRSTVWEVLEQEEELAEFLLWKNCWLGLVVVVVSNEDDVWFASRTKERRCVAIASTSADVIVRTGACNETGKSVWIYQRNNERARFHFEKKEIWSTDPIRWPFEEDCCSFDLNTGCSFLIRYSSNAALVTPNQSKWIFFSSHQFFAYLQ